MSRNKRIAVTIVFLIGLMSVAASIARMAIYLTVLYQGYSAGYDLDRKRGRKLEREQNVLTRRTETVTTMLWWSLLETALAAIAACLPSLSFLAKTEAMRKFYGRVTSLSGSRNSGSRVSWRPWRIGGSGGSGGSKGQSGDGSRKSDNRGSAEVSESGSSYRPGSNNNVRPNGSQEAILEKNDRTNGEQYV